MTTATIDAVLDDGPRAGEVLQVATRPDGSPPRELAVRDPLAPRADHPGGMDAVLPHATTYRLHERRGPARYAYRTGSWDESDHR